jgi:hypothetical protein
VATRRRVSVSSSRKPLSSPFLQHQPLHREQAVCATRAGNPVGSAAQARRNAPKASPAASCVMFRLGVRVSDAHARARPLLGVCHCGARQPVRSPRRHRNRVGSSSIEREAREGNLEPREVHSHLEFPHEVKISARACSLPLIECAPTRPQAQQPLLSRIIQLVITADELLAPVTQPRRSPNIRSFDLSPGGVLAWPPDMRGLFRRL